MATRTTFTIVKGEELQFDITIKRNGSLEPLTLSPSDTFSYTLIDKRQMIKYAENIPMTIAGTKVHGVISPALSSTLPIKKGMAEDQYIPRPSLTLEIQGTTAEQGDVLAIIYDVYVMEG